MPILIASLRRKTAIGIVYNSSYHDQETRDGNFHPLRLHLPLQGLLEGSTYAVETDRTYPNSQQVKILG